MIPLLLLTHLPRLLRIVGATGVLLFRVKMFLNLRSTLVTILDLILWNVGLLRCLKHLGTCTLILRLTLMLVLVNGSDTSRVILPLIWAPLVFTTLTTMVIG